MVGFFRYLSKPVFISTLILIFIFYSGLFIIPEPFSYNSLIKKDEVVYLECQILSSPVKNSNEKNYSVNVNLLNAQSSKFVNSTASGRIKVFIPSDYVEAYYPGKLYSSSKLDGNFVFEAGGIYGFKGKFVSDCFYVSKCSFGKWPDNFLGKIDFFRAKCRLQFKRLMFSWGEAGGLLLALLCGAKEYTDKITSENFRNAGLSHILALSGMHLSMFSSIAMFIGNKFKRKKVTFAIRIIVLFLFVWFAGLSPSLLRAYICAMLTLIATMTGTKQPDMLVILCFSFLLQSVISPSDIHNVGFILSYTALAGILVFNKFFFILYSKLFPLKISASFASSSSAQMFTTPISLKLFGTYAPIGIIATTIVSPLITVFIYSGLVLILLTLIFPFICSYSALFMNFLYNIIKFLVSFFSKAPKWSIN